MIAYSVVCESQLIKSDRIIKPFFRNSMYITIKKFYCVSEKSLDTHVTVLENMEKKVRYIKTKFEHVTVFDDISLE